MKRKATKRDWFWWAFETIFVIILITSIIWIGDRKTQEAIDRYHEATGLYSDGAYFKAMMKFYDLLNMKESIFDGETPRNMVERCKIRIEELTTTCPTCGQSVYYGE